MHLDERECHTGNVNGGYKPKSMHKFCRHEFAGLINRFRVVFAFAISVVLRKKAVRHNFKKFEFLC